MFLLEIVYAHEGDHVEKKEIGKDRHTTVL